MTNNHLAYMLMSKKQDSTEKQNNTQTHSIFNYDSDSAFLNVTAKQLDFSQMRVTFKPKSL